MKIVGVTFGNIASIISYVNGKTRGPWTFTIYSGRYDKRNINIRHLAKRTDDPNLKSTQSDMNSTLYVYFITPRVPNVRPFCSVISSSRDISRQNFLLTPMLNWKCTEWLQNYLKHLSVKSTLRTLNTHPRGPNFTPLRSTISHFHDTGLSRIRSTISHFQDTGLSRIRMHRMTP